MGSGRGGFPERDDSTGNKADTGSPEPGNSKKLHLSDAGVTTLYIIYQVGKLRSRYAGDRKLHGPLMKMTCSSSHDGSPLGGCSDIRVVPMELALSPALQAGVPLGPPVSAL